MHVVNVMIGAIRAVLHGLGKEWPNGQIAEWLTPQSCFLNKRTFVLRTTGRKMLQVSTWPVLYLVRSGCVPWRAHYDGESSCRKMRVLGGSECTKCAISWC